MSGVLAALAQELGTDPESLRDALFAGDESLQPTYLTTNAAGQVTAEFTGHVQAGGLDLIADNSTTINKPDRKIRWHQTTYNGPVVAEIDSAIDTGVGQSVIAMQARMAGIAPRANAQLIASDDINGIPSAFFQVGADDIAGKGSITYQVVSPLGASFQGTFIDSNGISAFAQLAATWRAALTAFNPNGTGVLQLIPLAVLGAQQTWDDSGGYSAAADSFTCPNAYAGAWLFTVNLNISSGTGGRYMTTWLTINGGAPIAIGGRVFSGAVTTTEKITHAVQVKLAAGDVVGFYSESNDAGCLEQGFISGALI